jgi:hypothetical protein
MTPENFMSLIQPISALMEGKPVDKVMEGLLNQRFGAESQAFTDLDGACRIGIKDGWLCNQGEAGRRFGRIFQPSPDTHGFSVDVVLLKNAHGPHHSHPKGEIVLTMPLTPAARFDGRGAGWLVYPPLSSHYPTVSGGEAMVLYLLPDGLIHFTK